MSILKKIIHLSAIGTVIITLVFVLLLTGTRLFGYNPYVILSGSMEPVIHTGSLAYIDMNDTDVEINDIVAFHIGESITVVHRLVDYDEVEDLYITKGDANESADIAALDSSQIIGTYKFSIPKLGYFVEMLESHSLVIGNFHISSSALLMIGFILTLNVLDYLLEKKNIYSV